MGLIFGLLKCVIKGLIALTIFAAVIVVIPNLPPYTTFSNIILEPTQPRVGPLASNEALNKAERLYVDKVLGPEAFQAYKGELYTSLASGEIVKLNAGGHVTFVTKLGLPCHSISQEPICGRPLGFEIDEANNVMYVADAYYGIWKVNLKDDKKQLLVSPRVDIESVAPKLFNSLTLAKNGDLYWSDSSSDFNLQNGVYSSLANPSGRLFYYNAASNQSKVLLDDLWFANGVAISPDHQFVVVVETFGYRLIKYFIAGPRKGKSEVFVAGLPGAPDNVRVLPDGSGLLVSLFVSFDKQNPLITRSMAETPLMRKFLARMLRLIEFPFEYLYTFYPHVILGDIVAQIGNFRSMANSIPKQSGIVVVDWNGNIVESYYNTDGTLATISDAIVWNNKLITGGPHQAFIGSIPVPQLLKKAFGSKIESAPKQKPVEAAKLNAEPNVAVKREAPKPVTPAPKPAAAKPVEPKPAAAKPVEQPKPATAKPVEQPKPAAAKPVAQPKPAAAKPVAQPKPAAAKPVAQPKPAAAKPVEQPKPAPAKPVEQPKFAAAKPVEQPKPAAAKPVEQPKPAAAKPVEQPKPAAAKPVEQAKPPSTKPVEQPKPAAAKPVEQLKPNHVAAPNAPQDAPKLEAKATPPVKKSAKTTTSKPAPKPVESEPEFIVTRPKEEALNEMKNKLAPENIPIIEEIPSDTVRPSKETLKVIKKGGPVEIPNPQL